VCLLVVLPSVLWPNHVLSAGGTTTVVWAVCVRLIRVSNVRRVFLV
jgi:hypothetical protein